jgi:hypothetical protein
MATRSLLSLTELRVMLAIVVASANNDIYRKPTTSMRLSSTRCRHLRCESRTLCVFEVTVRIVRYRKAFRVVAEVLLGVVGVASIHACLKSVLDGLADVVHAIAASWEVLRTVFSIDDPLFTGEGTAIYTVH